MKRKPSSSSSASQRDPYKPARRPAGGADRGGAPYRGRAADGGDGRSTYGRGRSAEGGDARPAYGRSRSADDARPRATYGRGDSAAPRAGYRGRADDESGRPAYRSKSSESGGFTVVLDPDVARVFRGAASVNKALRLVMQLNQVVQGPPPRTGGARPRPEGGARSYEPSAARFSDDDEQ